MAESLEAVGQAGRSISCPHTFPYAQGQVLCCLMEAQSTYIYKVPQVCPLVGIGTLPPPLSPARVPLPPKQRGVGPNSPAGEGLGESQFRRLEKKLSTLPTLRMEGIDLNIACFFATKLIKEKALGFLKGQWGICR